MSIAAFWYVSIALPLLAGTLLYVFIHKDGLFDLAENYCPYFQHIRVLLYHEVYPKSILGRFIKYQLGDLLWAYSLECSIALSTGNSHKALYYGLFWATATECFQLLSCVHATFDVWDILAQIAGVLIAYWIVQKFYHYQLYTFSKDLFLCVRFICHAVYQFKLNRLCVQFRKTVFSQIWHNIGSNCSYIPFIGLGFDSITSHVLHPLIYILSKRFIGAYSL